MTRPKAPIIIISHAESGDTKILVQTLTCFSNIDLPSQNDCVTSFGRISGQRRPSRLPYSILHSRLWLPRRTMPNPSMPKYSHRRGIPNFSNTDLTSRNHCVTQVHFSGQPTTFRLAHIRSCTADCGSSRGATMNPSTSKYSHGRRTIFSNITI